VSTRRYIVRFMPIEDGTQIDWGSPKYSNLGYGSADHLVGVLPAVYGPRGGVREPVRLVFLVATDGTVHPTRRRRRA
jgi:hypothetical protein